MIKIKRKRELYGIIYAHWVLFQRFSVSIYLSGVEKPLEWVWNHNFWGVSIVVCCTWHEHEACGFMMHSLVCSSWLKHEVYGHMMHCFVCSTWPEHEACGFRCTSVMYRFICWKIALHSRAKGLSLALILGSSVSLDYAYVEHLHIFLMQPESCYFQPATLGMVPGCR